MSQLRRYLVPVLLLLPVIFLCGKLLLTPVEGRGLAWIGGNQANETGWPWVFKRVYYNYVARKQITAVSWFVLLADVAVMVAAVATAAVSLARRYRRRVHWFQFSLRGLLALIAVFAMAFAWLISHYRLYKVEEQLSHTKNDHDEGEYVGPEWLKRLWPSDVDDLSLFNHFTSLRYIANATDDPSTVEYVKQLQTTCRSMPYLIYLNVQPCPTELACGDPTAFCGIESFCTASNKNIDDILGQLSKWRRLHSVEITDDKGLGSLSDRGMAQLSRCNGMECLLLLYSGCKISDAGVAHLIGLRQLRWLDLRSAPITDAAMESLMQMPSLETVGLSHCANLSDRGVRRLVELPRLTSLQLPGPPQISEDTIQLLKSRIENVTLDAN